MVVGSGANPPPGRIGSYEIVAEVGRGGMGVVYAARDPALGRGVAIKVLTESLSLDLEWSARFRREARLLASLNHPNIATIHSLERDGDVEFLTMELIRGQSLASVIESGSLSIPDALALARQIARALEAAHDAGVIHRDLKPLNVIVTPESHVKVLDFGLATTATPPADLDVNLTDFIDSPGGSEKQDESDPNALRERSAGSPIDSNASPAPRVPQSRSSSATATAGTPGYMSPEQIRGEPLDVRSDIWAFGCVLFELLTGARAFEGANPLERLRSSLGGTPKLARVPLRTPGNVRDLLESCLQKERETRLASMKDAREILETALARREWELIGRPLAPAPQLTANPHNLPSSLTEFVGRAREVAQVRELLRTTRLVTIAGVGGGGKTRVAIRVAEDALNDFADGVWLVELASVAEPVHVAQAVARALGLVEAPGQSLVDMIVAYTAHRSLLLIMDNCEHVIEGVAKLLHTLMASSSRLKILTTSRETVGLHGESVFPLPPLELVANEGASLEVLMNSEAVQLFAQRAMQMQPKFRIDASNVYDVIEICRRLDGIPLAIELAAARERVLPLKEIARRLDDRFRLLRGGSRTALAHHQTLEALIDWSHDHLTETEQILFRRLAVFRGGWTLEAAEFVCADDVLESWEVLDVLTRLIDKSLVVFTAARYRMLETVRQYAWNRLTGADDLEAVQTRFRDYFVAFTDRAARDLVGPGQADALVRSDAELDNIRAVIARTIDTADTDAALRVCGTMLRYWLIRGQAGEGRVALERALALPGAQERTLTLAVALNALGSCFYVRQDFDRAAVAYREAVVVMRAVGASQRAGIPLCNIGNIHRMKGEFEEATATLQEALEVLEGTDRWMIGAVHSNLGGVMIVRERYEEAAEHYRLAMEIHRDHGDRVNGAGSQVHLGVVAIKLGNLEEARQHLEEASRVLESLGERSYLPVAQSNLGTALILLEDYEGARAAFTRALRLAAETVNLELIASSLEGFGQVAQRDGDEPRSVRLCAAADLTRKQAGTPRVPSDVRDFDEYLARVKQELGAEAFDGYWNEGIAFTRDEAIEYALKEASQ